MSVTALTWRQHDPYHIKSADGRFSVSRMNVVDRIWYIAWHWPLDGMQDELGATSVAANASDAEKAEAIRAMRSICEQQVP